MRRLHNRRSRLPLLSLLLLAWWVWLEPPRPATAATEFAPFARLRSYDTPNFRIVYSDPDAAEAAREVGTVAEQVRREVLGTLGQPGPGRYTIVLLDNFDYANGSASGYPLKVIRLYLTAPSPPIGGVSDISDAMGDTWLHDLLLHEYTHAVHLNRFTGWTPLWRWAFHSNPFHLIYPGWFIEGLAVADETELSNRGRGRTHASDMFLRTAMLEHAFLPVGVWGTVTGWPRGGSRYLYGGAFLYYVQQRFGKDSLRRVIDATNAQLPWVDDVRFDWLADLLEDLGLKTDRLRNARLGGLERGFQKAVGVPMSELIRQWKQELEIRYFDEARQVSAEGLSRTVNLTRLGGGTRSPALSPDGKRVAYVAGADSEVPGLEVRPLDGGKARHLLSRNDISGPLAWSPDGARLVYARLISQDQPWGRILGRTDLFSLDLATRREHRLTTGLRVTDPAFGPDGSWLVAVAGGGGRTRLMKLAADGSSPMEIFAPDRTYQLATPAVSPDARRIALSVFVQQEAPRAARYVIGLVDIDGTHFQLLPGEGINREPEWIDADRLVFSSDRSGIFNLYTIDLRTGGVRALSNVLTGAFQPRVRPGGSPVVVFRGYSSRGFDVMKLMPDREEEAALRGEGPGRLVAQLEQRGMTADAPQVSNAAQRATLAVVVALHDQSEQGKGLDPRATDPGFIAQRQGVPAGLSEELGPGAESDMSAGRLEGQPGTGTDEDAGTGTDEDAGSGTDEDAATGTHGALPGEVDGKETAMTPAEAGVIPLPEHPAPETRRYHPLSDFRLAALRPQIGRDEGSSANALSGGTTLGAAAVYADLLNRHYVYLEANLGIQSTLTTWTALYSNQTFAFPVSVYAFEDVAAVGSLEDGASSWSIWQRNTGGGLEVGLPFNRGHFSANLVAGSALSRYHIFYALDTVGLTGRDATVYQQLDFGWGVANSWRTANGVFASIGSSADLLHPDDGGAPSTRWQATGNLLLRRWLGRGVVDLDLQAGIRQGEDYSFVVGGYDGTWSLPGIPADDGVRGNLVGMSQIQLSQDLWRPQAALGQVPWFYLERVEGLVNVGGVQAFDTSSGAADFGAGLAFGLRAHLFTLRSSLDLVPQVSYGVDLRTGERTWWFTLGGWPDVYKALVPIGLPWGSRRPSTDRSR